MRQKQTISPNQPRVEDVTLEIQEVLNKLSQMQKSPPPLNNATDLLAWELEVKAMTDRLQGLIVAQSVQEQLDKPEFKAQAREVSQSSSKKNA